MVQPQHQADGNDGLRPIAPSRGTHTTPETDANTLLGFLLARFSIKSTHWQWSAGMDVLSAGAECCALHAGNCIPNPQDSPPAPLGVRRGKNYMPGYGATRLPVRHPQDAPDWRSRRQKYSAHKQGISDSRLQNRRGSKCILPYCKYSVP